MGQGNRLGAGACIGLLLYAGGGAFAAEDHTQEIARSQRFEGTADAVFSALGQPTLNNAGAVLFAARLAGDGVTNANNSGIYRAQLTEPLLPVAGGLAQLVREGANLAVGGADVIPGDVFLASTMLEDPEFDLVAPISGKFDAIALELRTTAGLADGDSLIAVETLNAGFERAGVEGEDAPGGDGSFRDLVGFRLFGIGVLGEVGYFAALNATSQGAANDTGIYRYDDGAITELAREGATLDGTVMNGLFAPRMNRGGAVAFLAGLASGDPLADMAVVRVAAGGSALSRLVTAGDEPPDSDGRFATFGELRINGAGAVAFTARLRDTDGLPDTPFAGNTTLDDSGLYLVGANGTVTELAREGDELTPGGERLGAFADPFTGDLPRPALNDAGEAAFRARLFDAQDETASGLFIAAADGLRQIAHSGDAYDDGVLAAFAHPALNNRGMVAFEATLNVGDGASEEGVAPLLRDLLIVSDGIDHATVVREGELLNGETVFDISFNADPTRPTNGFDDNGRVTYLVTYASGLQAINVWTPRARWRGAFSDPDEERPWDDAANWRFGMRPNAAHDADLSPVGGGTVLGPDADTTVDSLTVGGAGATRLRLGSGVLGTVTGLTIAADGQLAGGGSVTGAVDNGGRIVVTPGLALDFNGDIVNRGEIEVNAGATVRFAEGYAGAGPISGAGTVLFDGELSPGESPGLLAIEGDAVLGAGSETLLELAGLERGTGYDAGDVGGTLTLGGVLHIVLLDGFTPAVGQSFLLFSAAALTGDFAAVFLPTVDGVHLALLRDASSLRLAVAPVPLPAPAWLLGIALAGLLTRRRARA